MGFGGARAAWVRAESGGESHGSTGPEGGGCGREMGHGAGEDSWREVGGFMASDLTDRGRIKGEGEGRVGDYAGIKGFLLFCVEDRGRVVAGRI